MLRHLGRLSLLNVENSRQGEMVVGFSRPGQRFVGQLLYFMIFRKTICFFPCNDFD